ncbi:MAG: hypothetical protein P8J89_10675 [Phycisphaerales bacterium]|nr:hypothetical protein [Phycisphaerales bacterium]
MADPLRVELGRIVGAHALAGEVRVRWFGDGPENLLGADFLFLAESREDPEARRYAVLGGGSGRSGEVRLRLSGVDDRNGAEALRGSLILINPWALHLDAVFRLTRGENGYGNDFSMAENSLEELRVISPRVMPQLKSELEWATRGTPPPPTTWIYFMNGMGPYLEQITIPMPLPLSGGFTMPTLALPDMKFNEAKLDTLRASTNDEKTVTTRVLADTAAISASQFKERLPIIITHEAIRATGKAIATYVLMRAAQDNSYVAIFAIGALIYQVGSAQADLRCWRTMPSDIQTAHLPTPTDGLLRFTTPDGRSLGSVELTPDESHIVVVSLPSPTVSTASIMPIQLTGDREQYVPIFSLKPPPEQEELENEKIAPTTAEVDVDQTESISTKTTS